jgi:hypothetical protein
MRIRNPAIAYLQIICRLLNEFLKVGDLEGVVFDFYMLGDLDVSPETAAILDQSKSLQGRQALIRVTIILWSIPFEK